MRKPVLAFAAGLTLALGGVAAPARAQPSIILDKIGDIQSGAYIAGDKVKFTLVAHGGDFLLRFDSDPEVFVLYADRASFGGRVLKYDSGQTALQVSGWGGVTLYTDAAPNGLPAVRSGDAGPIAPQPVSLADMQNAAADDADDLLYNHQLGVSFTADWGALAQDANARALAYDALENAAHALARLCNQPGARQTLGQHINAVSVATASHPTIALNGKTLVVTFNPARGFEGRASSRAIARALAGLFRLPQKAG